MTATGIDELMKRLEDDSAIFTAYEVRKLIEWKCNETAKKAISSSTIEAVMQNSQRIAENSNAQWALLFSQISSATVPMLESVGGTDEQE